ncbi:MAG: hypothetical protein HRT38_20555 [Alteromonadaceae bacterium]|nr:hypothetical protein [Alteromonadaceae bacterium]
MTVVFVEAVHGLVTINADNSLSYQSICDLVCADIITYRIRDTLGGEAEGTVNVAVIQKPLVKVIKTGGGAVYWLMILNLALLVYRSIVYISYKK